MGNDFDSCFGFNSGSGGGSSDTPGSSGSGFSSGSDFNSGSGFSSGNDFNSGSGFSSGNDFNSGSGFSSGNDFNSGSGFSSGNDFNSGSGFNSGNSFGGMNGEDSSYDPNAPLYQPEPMAYDPNAPLYTPERSASTVRTIPPVQQRSNKQALLIVAIVLVVAIIGGIAVYNVFFAKKSIKQYYESDAGQKDLANTRAMMERDSSIIKGDMYIEGDDILVMDVQYDWPTVSIADREEIQQDVEKALKPMMQKEINRIMNKGKLKAFSVRMLIKDKAGNAVINLLISP